MLVYLEDIDQVINTDSISRIYQYAIPNIRIDDDIVRQLEEGVSPKELKVPEAEYHSTIKLKDGTTINSKLKVKDIIREMRKENKYEMQ